MGGVIYPGGDSYKYSETYAVEVSCSNCGTRSPGRLPKGTKVGGPEECRNCGCDAVVRPSARKWL